MIKFKLSLILTVTFIANFSSLSAVSRDGDVTHRACIYYYAGSIFQIIDEDTFRVCPIPTAEPRPGETIEPETYTFLYSDGNRDYFKGYTDKEKMCEVDVRTIIYPD